MFCKVFKWQNISLGKSWNELWYIDNLSIVFQAFVSNIGRKHFYLKAILSNNDNNNLLILRDTLINSLCAKRYE